MSTNSLSDPTGWSDERLLRHAAEWCDLPLTAINPVMGDADLEAHGDLLYIRGMVDDLTAAKVDLEREAKSDDGRYTDAVFWLHWLHRNADFYVPVSWSVSPPWREAPAPMEALGDQIAAWGEELGMAA